MNKILQFSIAFLLVLSFNYNGFAQFTYSDSTNNECMLIAGAQTISTYNISVPKNPRRVDSDGILKLRFVGDLDGGGTNEALYIEDENGNQLASTPSYIQCSSANLSWGSLSVVVPKQTLLNWVSDGSINFTVSSYSGVNPNGSCNVNSQTNVSWCARVTMEWDYLNFKHESGVTNISSPNQVICDNSTNIVASATNFGLVDMDSVTFNWRVIRKGVSSAITSVKWSGKASRFASTQPVNLGSFSLGFKHGDRLQVWTSNPNGVTDSVISNDTTSINIRRGFAGTYTVGGLNSTFNTIEDLNGFIDSVGSVCDTTHFSFRNGTYKDQIVFDSIWNSDVKRPIFLESISKDRDRVQIKFAGPKVFSNYIVNVHKTNGVNLKDLTVYNSTTKDYKTAVSVVGSNGFTIDNCVIKNSFAGGSSDDLSNLVEIHPSKFSSNGTSITNSLFEGGNVAIKASGLNADTINESIKINNNTFNDFHFGAIEVLYTSFAEANNNSMSSGVVNFSPSTAILFNNITVSHSIKANEIISFNDVPSTAIEVVNSESFPLNKGVIANNFISLGYPASVQVFKAINVESSFLESIVHNSIYLQGISPNSNGMIISNGAGVDVLNNVVLMDSVGSIINVNYTGANPINLMNYNNYFTNMRLPNSSFGALNLNTYKNLNSWKINTGFDVNSKSVDPIYKSAIDLHACNSELDNAGVSVKLVNNDFDGQPRSLSKPDIGADEYSSVKGFSIGTDTLICKGVEVTLSAFTNPSDSAYSWSDGSSNSTLKIKKTGVYSVTAYTNCGVSHDTVSIDLRPSVDLGNDTVLCYNQNYNLVGNLKNATYSWNTGKVLPSINIKESGVYIAQAVDSVGCNTFDTVQIIKTEAIMLGKDTALCNGNNFFIIPNTGVGTYSWSTGAKTSSILVMSSDYYSVIYTDQYGCMSSDSVQVDFVTNPNAKFTSAILPSSAYTVDFSSTGYSNSKYLWDFGDGDTSSLQNPVHLYPASGTYVTTLKIINACGEDTYTEVVPIAVGINEQDVSSNISIYPNPASGTININSGNFLIEKISFNSIDGSLLESINVNTINTNHSLDISFLPAGIFMLEIETVDGNRINQKLIVE